MGEAKRRKKPKPLDLPVSDNPEITTTSIYPTIEAMWQEEIVNKPWFEKYSPVFRRALRDAVYMAASETVRTAIFRINADQDMRVFDDFGAEIDAENRKRNEQLAELIAERH